MEIKVAKLRDLFIILATVSYTRYKKYLALLICAVKLNSKGETEE